MPQTLGIVASSISGHLITSNFFLINQQNVSSGSTVTFSGIPATYKSLQVRFNLVNTSNTQIYIQFNGDGSVSNYAYHYLTARGSSVTAGGYASGTQGSISVLHTGAVSTYPTVAIIDVVDYANTSKNKTAKVLAGSNDNLTTDPVVELVSGLWLSTAVVTSLTISTSSSFTGTVSLYGVS